MPKNDPRDVSKYTMVCSKCGHTVYVNEMSNTHRFTNKNGTQHDLKCPEWTKQKESKERRKRDKAANSVLPYFEVENSNIPDDSQELKPLREDGYYRPRNRRV